MSQSSEFIRAVLAGWWVSPFVGGGVVGEVFELVWHRGWEGRGTRRRRMTVAGKWHAFWKAVNEISKNNNNNQLQLSSNHNNQLLMHALTQADGDGFG
jgi:hypothetical protein